MNSQPPCVDSEDSRFRIQLHAYNLLSTAGSTVPDPLLRTLETAMFSPSGEVTSTSYVHVLRELVDPSAFMSHIQSTVRQQAPEGSDDRRLGHFQEILRGHKSIMQKAQAIRTKDWVQKLKTPLAAVPSQSRLGTAKLLSFFAYVAETKLDTVPGDFEKACRFFWSIIDEFKLSYFIVVDSFVTFVEHGIESSFSEEFVVSKVTRMSAMVNTMEKIIPNLKALLADVIRTRVRLHSSQPFLDAEATLFRVAVAATVESSKEAERKEIFDQFSYYFLPTIPFSLTSAVGLLIGMGILSIEWYVEQLAQAVFMREVQHYASIDQTNAYIPYWFYHAAIYSGYRSFLAKRKKTKINMEGAQSGNLGLADASTTEDFLLYLTLWKHARPDAAASASTRDEPEPLLFLTDNPFIDLFSALLQVGTHFDSSVQPLSIFLEWMERSLGIAKLRVGQCNAVEKSDPGSETPPMTAHAFGLLPFGKPERFSEFSTPHATFSIFDYAPTLQRRRVSFIAGEFISHMMCSIDNQVNFLDVYALLYRLGHRIVEYPLLLHQVMRDGRLRHNYSTVMRCIIPALAIVFVKPEFSKLSGVHMESNGYLEHCASSVFTFHRTLVELYQSDAHRKISAFDGENDVDPVLRAIDQTNRELIHYKLIRLVPATIAATRLFIHAILLASPVLVLNIFIEQSIKKPNYQLMVQQSKLLRIPGDQFVMESESWSAFLSLNRKRLQLLAILSLNTAKRIEGGIFSFEQKENEISSIASFYCISCRSIIYHILERLENQPSAAPGAPSPHRWHAYACIRSIFRFAFSHILKDRAYKITVLMFMKAIAEHLLFETCFSETGVTVDVNRATSDESFDQVSSLFSASIRGWSPLSMRHLVHTHRKKNSPLFAQLEKSCHRRFVMGRLIQWFTSIFGGYSLFLANGGETGDSDLHISYHIITYVLFIESLFGIHVIPDRTEGPTTKYCSHFHDVLTGIKGTLIDSFQDESGTSEGLLLRRLRKLIDICIDLQTIYSDEEPFIEPAMTRDLDLPEALHFEPYDVCYSTQAYQDLIYSLQQRQKVPTIDAKLSSLCDFFHLFQKPRTDDSYIVGLVIQAIQLVEVHHKEDCAVHDNFQISNTASSLEAQFLPSISQLLAVIAKSIHGAFAAALYVTTIFGFRDVNNSTHHRDRPVLAVADYIQHYVKQILSAIFITLPCYTSGESTKVGIFINTTLCFVRKAMDCGCEDAREIYEESTIIIERRLLSVLASACPTHEVKDEELLDSANPDAEQQNKAPLYLLQNCLVLLWEIRFHLRTTKGSVGFLRSTEYITSVLLSAMESSQEEEENKAAAILNRLLGSRIQNDEIEIIKPQVIALIKWMNSQKGKDEQSSSKPSRSLPSKRCREGDILETTEIEINDENNVS